MKPHFALLFAVPLAGCAIPHPGIYKNYTESGATAFIIFDADTPFETYSTLPGLSGHHSDAVQVRAYDASNCPQKRSAVVAGALDYHVRSAVATIPAGIPIQIGMRYVNIPGNVNISGNLTSYTLCTLIEEFTPVANQQYIAKFAWPVKLPDKDNLQCALSITTASSSPQTVLATKRDDSYCPLGGIDKW